MNSSWQLEDWQLPRGGHRQIFWLGQSVTMQHQNSRRPVYEMLETRTLLAFTVSPDGFEQEMLELVNEMRLDPLAGLARLVDSVDANPASSSDPHIDQALRVAGVDGRALRQEFARLPPAAPLAWADVLYSAASDYTQVMIAAQQQRHDLPPLPSLGQRVLAAAADDPAAWRSFSVSENIFGSGRSLLHSHAAIAIDWAGPGQGIQNPPSHRQNLLNPERREIGISVLRGAVEDTVGPADVTGPFVVVQNLASRQPFGDPILLGVAHTDLNGDGRYTAGEAHGGATVTVVGVDGTPTPDSNTTETLWPSGAYQMPVPPGRYDVVLSNGTLPETRIIRGVDVLADTNRKVDFVDGDAFDFPVVRFDPVRQSVPENAGTIQVWPTLSAPAPWDISVPFATGGSATAGEDYVIQSSPLIIPAGQWFAPISIQVVDDDDIDPHESIEVVLRDPQLAALGSDVVHTAVLVDNEPLPAVSWSLSSTSVIEDEGVIEILLLLSTPISQPISVPFVLGGTALLGADYSLSPSPAVIPVGADSATVSLTLHDEAVPESTETITVAIGDTVNAEVGEVRTFIADIADNDSPGDWTNSLNPA